MARKQTLRTPSRAPKLASAKRQRRVGGRSARVRSSVLRVAFEVLTEKGFHALTIGEVAARAGVHETSIYRRWGTKEALTLEASLHFAETAVPIPDTGSLKSDLVKLLKNFVTLMASPKGQVLIAMSVAKHPEGVIARQAYWQRRLETMRIILDRAVSRGEFSRHADPIVFLETLIAPLYFRALVNGQSIKDWAYEELIDQMLSGYGATARRRQPD
jgi:AcrR family transcriptional regulator